MDFDPRITSDGSGYGSAHGWHCNFHFGYGQDIIDEDVENEKSCMQVLQLLIAKADAEIYDLEDELAILQCQLKWAESDWLKDPYELFCAVFKRKIDSLTSSIESLRNGNVLSEEQTNATLELQRPAERIRDVIYALIRPEFPEFDEEVSTSEGNPKSDSLQCEESEKCTNTSKVGNGGTSPVLMEKEVTIKAEEVDYDNYTSLSEMLNHGIEDPVKDDLAFENPYGITYGRKKSSLSSILKPEGQKVRQKLVSNFGGGAQSISTLRFFEKIGKSEPYSDSESLVQGGLHFRNSQREPEIVEDLIYANPFQVRRQQQEKSHIESSKTKVSKGEASGKRGRKISSGSPQLTEATDSQVIDDLKNLRIKLSKDPDYLTNLTVRQLREIMRQNKFTGFHKLKKEKLIEKLTKRLCP